MTVVQSAELFASLVSVCVTSATKYDLREYRRPVRMHMADGYFCLTVDTVGQSAIIFKTLLAMTIG